MQLFFGENCFHDAHTWRRKGSLPTLPLFLIFPFQFVRKKDVHGCPPFCMGGGRSRISMEVKVCLFHTSLIILASKSEDSTGGNFHHDKEEKKAYSVHSSVTTSKKPSKKLLPRSLSKKKKKKIWNAIETMFFQKVYHSWLREHKKKFSTVKSRFDSPMSVATPSISASGTPTRARVCSFNVRSFFFAKLWGTRNERKKINLFLSIRVLVTELGEPDILFPSGSARAFICKNLGSVLSLIFPGRRSINKDTPSWLFLLFSLWYCHRSISWKRIQ